MEEVAGRTPKWVIAGLFFFIYVPFLYQQGYQRAFTPNGDFPSIYWAAKITFVERRSPYTTEAFSEAESQLKQHLFPYLYPPPSLLMFYPFSRVSYQTAQLLMLITSHVSLLVFIYLFFFEIRAVELHPPRVVAALSVVYVLMFYPVVDNFLWGQINLPVLALLCLAWYGLKRGGDDLTVAVPLLFAVLLKTYPLLFVPLLIIKKRYRAVVLFLGLLGLYTFTAWMVLPRSAWNDWFENVLPTGGYGSRPFNLFLPVAPWNHSINGFGTFVLDRYPEILRLPSRALTTTFSYLLAACVTIVTVGLSYRCTRGFKDGGSLDLEVSLFLLMMFLVAPLSWEHHLVYVLPTALIAMRLLLNEGAPRALGLTLVAALFILAWEFPRDEMFFLKGILAFLNPIKFYAVFAVWVFFVVKVRGRLRADSVPGHAANGA